MVYRKYVTMLNRKYVCVRWFHRLLVTYELDTRYIFIHSLSVKQQICLIRC